MIRGDIPRSFGQSLPWYIIMMLMLIALVTPSASLVEADGPWLNVHDPVDGCNLTTRETTVRGDSTAPSHSVSLGVEELGDHNGSNMAWDSGALVMQPVRSFSEDFSGSVLDPTKWIIVRDKGEIHIQNGALVMASYHMNEPREPMGQIMSVGDIFPDKVDWTAEFKLTFNMINYYGSGGGISPGPLTTRGTMAVVGSLNYQDYPLVVYANGLIVSRIGIGMYNLHTYKLEYSSATRDCRLLMDDYLLKTFPIYDIPSHLWFGSSYNMFIGSMMQTIYQVDIWTYSGHWLSRPYDFGHEVDVDGLKARMTTTHQSSTNFSIEARVSNDNSSWSEWIHAVDIGKTSALQGRYLQLRVNAELPGVKSEQGKISFSSFDVTYREPIVSVEARRSTGSWVAATGNESWNVKLDLEEDINFIEVRATDASGVTNETSINVTVDTTPPIGTVSILTDVPYINDPNITLSLNATDKYGVATVQVSNAPDMTMMRTFPYSTELSWNIEGADGEVSVYARFVDFHGLLSEIVRDSIIIDSVPPSGSLTINDGALYTASTKVHLDLDYYDDRGMATITLSNRPDLSDGMTITPPQVQVDPWDLEGGDDGLRTVYIRLTDVAGNIAFINATIDLYIPKALGNVTIEEGADLTQKSIVELQILIPRELKTTRGQLSNDADFERAEWETLTQEKVWILSPGDGHRTVFLRFEDFRGIVSLPVNASITVDNTPPNIQVLLEDGAKYTTVSDLTATMLYDDASPSSRMWMADNDRLDLVEAEPFSATFLWSVPASEGDYSLHVMVEDLAGNTATAFTSIHYATKVPVITLVLPGGPNSNAEGAVDVTVEWVDEYGDIEVKLAFDSDPTILDEWMDLDGPQSLTIPPGTPDGAYLIKGVARNIPGLESDIVSLTIVLDRAPPTLIILDPADGSKLTQEGKTVKVDLQTDDLESLRYRIDGGEWMAVPDFDGTLVMDIASYGEHTLEIHGLDDAGNEAVSTSTFKLEKEESGVPGVAALLALSALVCAGLIIRRRA